MPTFIEKIFGDPNKKVLSALEKEVQSINALEETVSKLNSDELKAKTAAFRQRLEQGESLDALTHEAFACVREAAKRTLGQRHFDVQLVGGLVLYRGGIAEMRTGEGKTLTSTLPLYTNALSGKGCHLVTVNDYLAKRDCVWMGQVFNALGLTVGCITHENGYVYDPAYVQERRPPLTPPYEGGEQALDAERDETGSFRVQTDFLRPVSRKDAYATDITYGTNNEFGFDYLRDNMAATLEQCVMRGLQYAIVDEVDSILIDEARTPLIISAPAEESNKLYERFAQIVRGLKENEDYNIDEKMRSATFTEQGIEKVERALGIDNLYLAANVNLQHYAETALRALALFDRDVHYVVRENEVVIVDEFTGRMMPGRRFSEGQHQAIEAKEGVPIQRESLTLATITFQNFFRMYSKLAGMTGTAATEAEEFGKIYQLDVTSIPTHRPPQRKDLPDRVYKSQVGKYRAAVEEIKVRHEQGQPVLVGTASIEKNELLSSLLSQAGIPHQMLNAKNHAAEGEIIAQAGRPGAVTVATNMAGRGVDIMLGGNPATPEDAQKVKDLGGLHVLGTERHESRRIDNQLRGRAGRQGDPGSSQFCVSMEDDLMRIFGSDRAKAIMDRLGIPEDMPIENKMISNSIEKAQTRVEGHHFDTRKHLLEYDDVLNKHREAVYARRREVLEASNQDNKEGLRNTILELVENEIEQVVLFHTGDQPLEVGEGDTNTKEITEVLATIVPLTEAQRSQILALTTEVSAEKLKTATQRTAIVEAMTGIVKERYDAMGRQFEKPEDLFAVERAVMTRAIDTLWIDHLAAMTALRTGIGLQGYGQRDPLIEYKKEAYGMFQHLLSSINQEIVYSFFKYAEHMAAQKQLQALNVGLMEQKGIQLSGGGGARVSPPLQGGVKGGSSSAAQEKIGRNDPCPCGSGKKYKKCHGA